MTLTWFLFATLPSVLFSLSQLVDQYIIRLHSARSPYFFLALSGLCCFPIVFLMLPWAVADDSFNIAHGIRVMLAGLLFSACLVPYFYALEGDDAHVATPVFQLCPVFVAILSWAFLYETLEPVQMIGGLVVVIAAAASLVDPHHLKFNARPFWLITLSSLLYSCHIVVLRSVATDMHWMMATFWLSTGWFLMSLAMALTMPRLRRMLLFKFQNTRGRIFAISTVQECADIAACTCNAIALAFIAVPAAVTELVQGVSPFMMALFTFIAARMIPSIYSFDLTRREIVQKAVCFTAMLFGLSVVTGVIALP